METRKSQYVQCEVDLGPYTLLALLNHTIFSKTEEVTPNTVHLWCTCYGSRGPLSTIMCKNVREPISVVQSISDVFCLFKCCFTTGIQFKVIKLFNFVLNLSMILCFAPRLEFIARVMLGFILSPVSLSNLTVSTGWVTSLVLHLLSSIHLGSCVDLSPTICRMLQRKDLFRLFVRLCTLMTVCEMIASICYHICVWSLSLILFAHVELNAGLQYVQAKLQVLSNAISSVFRFTSVLWSVCVHSPVPRL